MFQVRKAQADQVEGLRVAALAASAFWPSDLGRVPHPLTRRAEVGDVTRTPAYAGDR